MPHTSSRSCISISSNGSSTRYRTVAVGSSIDESLFGPKRDRNCKRKKFDKIAGEIDCYKALTISVNDLQRIQLTDRNISPQPCCAQNEESNRQSSSESRAVSRKEYMINLDRQLKEKELIDNQGRQGLREQVILRAAQTSDKDNDIVKMLHSCQQRAAAFAIRDEQLRDKQSKLKKEKEYEKMTDLAMEVDRIKELAKREMDEKVKIQKRIEDRKIIENQIQERNVLKMLQEEAREQENHRMLEASMRLSTEAQIMERKKRDDAKLAHLEALKWNEYMLAQKMKIREEEKREDALLLAYQASRDEALRKRDEEEKEAIRKKQEIQKKLLDSQNRVLDKQADLDELRSRRAFEEKERRYRKKQLEEHQRRKSEMIALVQACRQQQIEKLEAEKKEKIIKEQEYLDTLRWNAEAAQREQLDALKVKRKNDELRNILREQIREKEEKERKDKDEKFQEGRRMRETILIEKHKIEKIRDDMVHDMRLKGVHEKYFGEMLSLDVEKCLMR